MSAQEENKTNLSYGDIAKIARGRAAEFAEDIIGERPTYKGAAEIRFLENQSLVVYTKGKREGTFRSFSDDSGRGDMIDLCKYIRGMNSHEALLYAKDKLGISESDIAHNPALLKTKSPEEQEREAEAERQKKIRVANWIWNSSSPTEGKEEGEAYLKGRGLKGPFDSNLIRYRKISPEDLKKMGVDEKDIPKTPVVSVVFKATNAKGELTAVQQVLTTQGQKITKVVPGFENPKRTNGHLIGSAVKFGGDKPKRLILAEGPETALSLFESTKIPTWITLGTSNYTTLQMPKSVEESIVASDMEPSGVGLGAALKAAQHWTRVGVPKVGIALPRLEDGDFNDVHQQQGAEAVKKMVDTAFYGAKPRALDTVLVTADSRAAFHVWQKTGLDTRVRVPGNKKDGNRFPIMLDHTIDDHHKQVLIIEREGFTIVPDQLKKDRPDVTIITVSEDSKDYLQKAKKPGFVEASISEAADMYAPGGKGTKEPMAFCLRRADADALHDAGHKVIAIRSTALDRVDLSFMNSRKAFVCPIGEGTREDEKLEARLDDAGAETTRLKWQLFRPDEDGFKIVRKAIPAQYGAKDAVEEGWKGEKMAHLLKLSTNEKETLVKEQTKSRKKDQER